MPADRPPTLDDVARRAGVHPATVSRALNRPDMVAVATRDAVLAAVAAVGFVPNRSARQLAGGRTGAIGVLVPDITNPYFAAIVQAIQADARHDDLAVLIADTAADPDEEERAVRVLGRQVDGIVAVTPITDLLDLAVPVVKVNRIAHASVGVVVDQDAIATQAIEHLVGLGHRHLAVVRGPAPYWSAVRRDRAVVGLKESLATDGVRIDLLGPAAATFDGGVEAQPAVEASGATAALAFNDLQAVGLLVASDRRGIDVPGALSIVGSDGLEITTMTSPAITTVVAPLDDLGRTARRRLAELLAERAGPATTTLEPHLVVRATTAPPPSSRETP